MLAMWSFIAQRFKGVERIAGVKDHARALVTRTRSQAFFNHSHSFTSRSHLLLSPLTLAAPHRHVCKVMKS